MKTVNISSGIGQGPNHVGLAFVQQRLVELPAFISISVDDDIQSLLGEGSVMLPNIAIEIEQPVLLHYC